MPRPQSHLTQIINKTRTHQIFVGAHLRVRPGRIKMFQLSGRHMGLPLHGLR